MTETETRTVADRCRASCAFTECTGRGSLAAWAHECTVVGIPRAVPTCRVASCSEPGLLYPSGRYCPPHGPAPAPAPSDPIVATPSWTRRTEADYGNATTDPLGRTGPVNQYGLPTRGHG